jgi:transposase
MASGHMNRVKRPDTWLHRPMLQNVKEVLAKVWTPPPGEVKSRTPAATKEDVMQVVRIGLDLAKYVFEVHGVDSLGKVVVRKTPRRDAVARFFANLPRCLVGMEASNGAHY